MSIPPISATFRHQYLDIHKPMEALLKAENISKTYAGHQALSNINITIPKGSIYGLLGPNGAGKTSFIRILNQITGPDTGTILFNGEPLSPKHIARIGYLPEERGLYKKMTVGEQAMYLARLKGLTKQEAKDKLKYWFEKFEITAWWNKKVEELSKGMAQKVQFIVTVLHEPELLIFDEPFSGFDPINANLIKNEILELSKKGSTIIFSTHRMESVEELCDHIALINQSEKILEGKLSDIKERYRTFAYELTYVNPVQPLETILNGHYEIKSNHNNQAVIQAPEGTNPNDILQKLLPHLEVHSFQEKIPSVNDIFIQAVNQKSN
ncbi:MAG: ABC-2 type transport system ATP-binding protein [Flavobacteriales bacterium]